VNSSGRRRARTHAEPLNVIQVEGSEYIVDRVLLSNLSAYFSQALEEATGGYLILEGVSGSDVELLHQVLSERSGILPVES
jgi:hypothetical protein